MKLLLINYEFPPLGGGSATASYNLAKELAKLSDYVIVITTYFPGLPLTEKKDDFKIIRVKSQRKRIDRSNPIEMLSFIIESLKISDEIIKKNKPDKVIAFFTIPSGIIALYLKIKYKIPYIVSLRGGDVPGFQGREILLYHILLYPLILIVWFFSKNIVANSRSLQKLAQRSANIIRKKVNLIPNGVDSNIFKPSKKKFIKMVKKILVVGRLVKQKNIETILKAINLLKNKYRSKIKLDIVGDGPEKDNLIKTTSEYRISDSVTFSGWLSRERLIKKYQSADIFISSSLYEGMSNVILEALACGLPVVASDINSNQELIKPNYNGILYKIKNSNELTMAIISILNNESLEKSLSRGSIKTAETLSWKNCSESYYRMLKKF